MLLALVVEELLDSLSALVLFVLVVELVGSLSTYAVCTG